MLKNIGFVLSLLSFLMIACKPEQRVDMDRGIDVYLKTFEDSVAAKQAAFEQNMLSKKFTFACYDFCENNPLLDLNDLNQGKEVPLAVSYRIIGDSLNVKFRFVNDCCANYIGDYDVYGDTLVISFKNNSLGLCDCYCNYYYRFSKPQNGKKPNYLKINNTILKVDTLPSKMPAVQLILPKKVKFKPPQNS
jgi:hypothetical protein